MHHWDALSQETYTLWNSFDLLQMVFMQKHKMVPNARCNVCLKAVPVSLATG